MTAQRKRWQMKHIADEDCRRAAALASHRSDLTVEVLAEITGAPQKVCYRKIEQMVARGLMNYGTSPASAWWEGPR